MGNAHNKLNKNSKFNNIKELKYNNNQYNYKNVLNIPLILNQLLKFMNNKDTKCLSLCSKDIYQLYCNQIKKLKLKEDITELEIIKLSNKYEYVIELDLEWCKNIEDFSIISKLNQLEILNLEDTNISDISFLENNKNIKELDLEFCKNLNKNCKIFQRKDIKLYYY